MSFGERWPEAARDERVARAVGFWWGYAEGVCFFIVPDVYVSFATLFSLRAGAMAWLASIAGSLAAVATIYGLGALLGAAVVPFVEAVPGIPPGMLGAVDRQLGTGLPYTPWLVLGGIPLKVYAAVASVQAIPLAAALVWTVFARIVRIAPTYLLAVAVRVAAQRSIAARPSVWIALLVALWIAFYTVYFIAMDRRVWF
ncbi:MAG: hypothetical protein ACREMN_08350 [Gemmatimonadales bacterium]